MAQTRKDLRGRVLRKGESQRRSDERYVYTYTDPLGRRKYVYAQDLVTLREKEAQLRNTNWECPFCFAKKHILLAPAKIRNP